MGWRERRDIERLLERSRQLDELYGCGETHTPNKQQTAPNPHRLRRGDRRRARVLKIEPAAIERIAQRAVLEAIRKLLE